MAVQRRHVIFRGHVQGVYFRATTAEIAKQLGLEGFVRNLADGSVEMEAQGDPATIDKLIAELFDRYNGMIHEVVATPIDAKPESAGFQVLQ